MRKLGVMMLLLAACGGEPGGEMNIAFKMHAQVQCDREGMQARLQASGVQGFCPLMVNADREVTGTCFNVPAGAERAFRLIYYASFDRDYELAVATQTLDLTDEKRSTIVLQFEEESLDTNRDDDGDGFINLVEFCCGSHPGINGETCN